MHLHPPEANETISRSPEGSGAGPALPSRRLSLRRRLAWVAGAVLVLVLLLVTPPLVNANRYRGKIAESMSKSLGRPVHLDGVSMHLLPVPGFTLQNLVVSEDPAFGAEPTIRANTVEASLRVSSLWHHPVEFSTVRFVEPSVNLVRNAEGRWNLPDVLLHASHVQSAPTGQRRAGPTPRFPYIEATGGRVNVKLGEEKLPFSLTEANFALWLSSPQQWRVRLMGHPARTDTNITDPGSLRIEGELRRAEDIGGVPVNFSMSWHDAPLGEATRILTGDDWGWRGTLNVDASLAGTLGDATVASKLTLGGLRRAEFFPSAPLDLQVTCGSQFAAHPGILRAVRCTLPDDAPQPLTLSAATVPLQQPRASDAELEGKEIPVHWALLWAALFSARVPVDLHPGGTMDVDMQHHSVPLPVRPVIAASRGRGRAPVVVSAVPATWTGIIGLELPSASAAQPGAGAMPNHLSWELGPPMAVGGWPTLRLPATVVTPGPGTSLMLSGSLNSSGYTFSATGSAAPAAILMPARYLPQLGDGLETVLPFPPTGVTPGHVQISCTRSWNTAQRCTGPEMPGGRQSAGATAVPGDGGTPPSRELPSALSPRNISPLERAPFSTPRPPPPATPQ